MTNARQQLGRHGEMLAAIKIEAAGYEVVERNYKCPAGELDIVARCGDVWVFVEVRTRRGRTFGSPEESVTPKKKAHLVAAAQTNLQEKDLVDTNWRIDFVAVELDKRGKLERIEIVENAVNGL